ncbi:hypothetical protein C7S13_5464 [Burkholderia cepacia]|nr:hypothetical protein [Burkholderia cepacia]
MATSIPSPIFGKRCVATRNNYVGDPARQLPVNYFYNAIARVSAVKTARTAVQQGFRGSGKSGPPRPRLASERAGRANSRFR